MVSLGCWNVVIFPATMTSMVDRGFRLIEHTVQDLRYAWRGLFRSRAFVAATVLTLAVGMSLVTVVFAIFNAYVLRPFAVRDPYSLYALRWRSQEAGGATFRWRDYQDLEKRRDLFDGVDAEAPRALTSEGRRLTTGFVSGSYFEALGPHVALGRGLLPSDARGPGAEAVVVLSHQAWTRGFSSDPSIVGRALEVNGHQLTIVGVMGPTFTGLDDTPRDVWIPVTMHGTIVGENLFGVDQPRSLRVTARLRRDVTPEQAQGSLALEPFATSVAGRIDPVRAELNLQATPVRLSVAGLAFLSPVFAAFVLVLVAACANASNVMLARANARHREIGVRLSVGAGRGRIVRQLMTEGFLLAALAGAVALGLAAVLLRVGTFLFVAMLPAAVAPRVRIVPLDFDARVFLFAFAVAFVVTILFALLPALQATRVVLTDALRGQAGASIRSSTLRSLFVTSQVCVSLLLLIVASTLVRNGSAIRATDLGLETGGVISVRPGGKDTTLVARTHAALTADPRVGQVVVASGVPLFGEPPRTPIWQPSGVVAASYMFVSPEYFSALAIAIVHGRGFSVEEASVEAPVAIVSAAAAHALWPGDEPLGKTVRVHLEPLGGLGVSDVVTKTRRKAGEDTAGSTTVTVVGIARDVVSGFVYQGKDPAHVYLPTTATGSHAKALMVKAAAGSISSESLRSILGRVHPDPLAYDVLPLEEVLALQMFPLRAASWVGSFLTFVALALSISGLYGVLTYTFGQRTKEIGIRIALGASASRISRLVLVYSGRLAAVGIALGLILGFTVMKILSSFIRLDNVSVVDPGAFIVSGFVILCAVALASFGPARRASRVDPSSMLRAD